MLIIDRIKVSLEGFGIWGGFEASISPDENPIEEWIKLRDKLRFAMENADAQKGTTVSPVPSIDYKAKEKVEAAIDNAKSADELISFQKQAQDLGLSSQFINKILEFTK